MKKVILFFLLVFFQNQFAQAQQFDFSIVSDFGGEKPDADSRSADEEKEILQTVIKDTYDNISPDLKDVATQITFVVDHTSLDTKTTMGYSAEEDARYKYPDRTFYNPLVKQDGTIRIVLTEKFVQMCDLMLNLIDKNEKYPRIIFVAKQFYRSILEHELVHAWQYYTNPVADLDRNMDFVNHGEMTIEDLIRATRIKVDNERVAYEMTMARLQPSDLELLAEAVEDYMKQNGNEFQPNEKYSLLNDDREFPLVNRYLLEAGKNVSYYYYKNKKQIPEKWLMIYEGQIRPIEIVQNMKEITKDKTKLSNQDKKKLSALYTELRHFEMNPTWNEITLPHHWYLSDYLNQAHVIFNNLK